MGSYTIESDILSLAFGKSLEIASAGLSAGPLIVADHLGFMTLRSVTEDGLSRVAFMVMKETFSPWSGEVGDIVVFDGFGSVCRGETRSWFIFIPSERAMERASHTHKLRSFVRSYIRLSVIVLTPGIILCVHRISLSSFP